MDAYAPADRLDPEGRLIDGQHRIAAVIEANMTVEMYVARDVPADVFHVIDTGRPRTAANVLQIAGIPSAVVVSGAVRMLRKYEATKGTARLWTNQLTAEISNDDILNAATSAEGILLRGQQSTADYMLNGVGRLGARVPIMVGLTVIRAASMDSPGAVSAYVEQVATGSMLPVNHPVLALRRWLATMYPQYRHYERGYATLIAFLKTWQAVQAGAELPVMSVRIGHEPLPDLFAVDVDPAPIDMAAYEAEQRAEAEAFAS